MNENDFSERTVYLWECYGCGSENFLNEIPDEEVILICPYCNTSNDFERKETNEI